MTNPDCHVALGILAVALVALCMRHWLARAERRHRSRRLKGDPKHMRLGQLVPDLDPDLDGTSNLTSSRTPSMTMTSSRS
mgnify:CR=1 FL=1